MYVKTWFDKKFPYFSNPELDDEGYVIPPKDKNGNQVQYAKNQNEGDPASAPESEETVTPSPEETSVLELVSNF